MTYQKLKIKLTENNEQKLKEIHQFFKTDISFEQFINNWISKELNIKNQSKNIVFKQIIDNTIKVIKQLPNQELINLISELENLIDNNYGNYTIGGSITIKAIRNKLVQEIIKKYK